MVRAADLHHFAPLVLPALDPAAGIPAPAHRTPRLRRQFETVLAAQPAGQVEAVQLSPERFAPFPRCRVAPRARYFGAEVVGAPTHTPVAL